MSKDSMSDQKSEYYTMNAKLCRLVQENPCMYDRSSPNYPRKDYVERAWAHIAKEMHDSVGSCKERWRNIRTAYARSVNIYKTPTGPNRHKRYYLHDELQFLTKHISPGLPSLPIRIHTPTELEGNNDNSHQSVEETDDNCTFQITLDSSSPQPPVHHTEDDHVHVPSPSPEPDCAELPSSPPNKRRKQTEPEDYLKDFAKIYRKRDPDSEFLNSLLTEMKTMNARQKIVFKGKIFRALEEVFDDSKDFPSNIQPSSLAHKTPRSTQTQNKKSSPKKNIVATITNSSLVQDEQRDALESAATTFGSCVPMVSLGLIESNIKQEPINVDE